jgi:hypothetical protein
MEAKPVFIEATFTPDAELAQELAALCRSVPEAFEEIFSHIASVTVASIQYV